MKINGFQELQKELEEMRKEAEKLQPVQQYALSDILTPQFLSKNTKYSNLEDFLKDTTTEEFISFTDEDKDKYVVERTNFNSWNEILSAGTGDMVAKRLGF